MSCNAPIVVLLVALEFCTPVMRPGWGHVLLELLSRIVISSTSSSEFSSEEVIVIIVGVWGVWDVKCRSIVILGPRFSVLLRLVGAFMIGVWPDCLFSDCIGGSRLSASVSEWTVCRPICFLFKSEHAHFLSVTRLPSLVAMFDSVVSLECAREGPWALS